jgi:hypothetical protein
MPTPEVRDNSGEERPVDSALADQGSSMNKALGSLEPRWPATIALLAVGSLRLALPASFSAGPNWLLLAVMVILILPTIWAHYCRFDGLNKVLGYILTSIVTADMIWSLYRLVVAIPLHEESPIEMLRSAAALWITNILVFASWYWRLDAGGPRGT